MFKTLDISIMNCVVSNNVSLEYHYNDGKNWGKFV